MGSYVPERVVTNAEVDAMIGEPTNDWLIENVGIRERRWMSPDQTTSDLIVAAAQAALNSAVAPADLDLIIVSTDTPDYLSPSTSVVVQHNLGATQAGCYDVNSACAGWVMALDQGARYLITEPTFRYVLVAGGYAMSRFLDLKDKKTANLFADGAGAAVLGVSSAPGWLASNLLAVVVFTMRWASMAAAHFDRAPRRTTPSTARRKWSSSRSSPKPLTPNTGLN